jgi:hypothetical protein
MCAGQSESQNIEQRQTNNELMMKTEMKTIGKMYEPKPELIDATNSEETKEESQLSPTKVDQMERKIVYSTSPFDRVNFEGDED